MRTVKSKRKVPRSKKPANTPVSARTAPDDETEQWIYTVRARTGEILKVEHVASKGGDRKEIPLDQLFASDAYAPQAYYDPYQRYYYAPYGWWQY